MNQLTEFWKTEKSLSLLTNRVWWLGAGLLCYIKLYPQNTYLPATYVCIQGWSHSMFLLRKILFLTQAVRNQRCIDIEWTIQNCNPLRWLNHFWKVLDSCNCLWARKRTKMFYLFIYLKKEEYTVYVYFLEEEIFHQKLCGLVISQTFTSWNTAIPFSLNTFDLPQTLQCKSLVTWKRD